MEERQKQMMSVCIPKKEPSKSKKELQRLCKILAQPRSNSNKGITTNQEDSISLIVHAVQSKKKSQTNQHFILSCLLYLFIKYKSLKVKITVKVNPNFRVKDSQNSIYLTINSSKDIKFDDKYFQNLQQVLWNEPYHLQNKKNFFTQLSFKCFSQDNNKMLKNVNELRSDTCFFISQFYQNLNIFFNDKPAYIMKNQFNNFPKITQNKNHETNRCVQSIKKLYSKMLILKGLSSQSLQILAKQQIYNRQYSCDVQEQSELQELGMYKQFNGSPFEYLQKIMLSINNIDTQINYLINLVSNTPNLNTLYCHQGKSTNIHNIDNLLSLLVQKTPLISRFCIANVRVLNVSTEVLRKLYIQCPYLIQLEIGLRYTYSISETYQHSTPEEKDQKETERQQQILLEALRLRNITLHNNIEISKLLLKKKYNFIETLQIVDCIQPICL